MLFEVWQVGRETPIYATRFQSEAESAAQDWREHNGRATYVTDERGHVVYRIRAKAAV